MSQLNTTDIRTLSAAEQEIDEVVARAVAAQRNYESKATQHRYDMAALGAAWALMEPERNEELSSLAVEITGLGNVADKQTKNYRKILGTLRDIKGKLTTGVISDNKDTGITEIARPIGVVGAVVPSTNPAATPTNNVVNALKCGNAIILSPSPAGAKVCEKLVGYIHAEFDKLSLDKDLVQMVPLPSSKEKTQRLMEACDLIIVTGSQDNVRRAYSSGTPAIGVGAGNATVIIDESADLAGAAQKIAASKTFDNATSCSSENVLIVLEAIKDEFTKELHKAGGRILDEAATTKLKNALFQDGKLNRHMIAKDIGPFLSAAGVSVDEPDTARFVVLPSVGIGAEFPESGEKLSLAVAMYTAADFNDATSIARKVLSHQGAGHSIGLHSNEDSRAVHLGSSMPTCRVIVNQAHCFATGGSFDNGLPFSLSMGCGSWGGNSIDDNLNYKHFMNTSKVVRPIAPNEPSLESIFTHYWAEAGRVTQLNIRAVMDERAKKSPDSTFIVDAINGRSISYSQAKHVVRSIATLIDKQGIATGESVAFAMQNSSACALVVLGIMYGGYRATAINLISGNQTIAYVLEHSESQLIVTEPLQRALLEEAFATNQHSVPMLEIDEALIDIFINEPSIKFSAAPLDDQADGLLMYTSGTTGRPKGVQLSHANLIAGGENTQLAHDLNASDRAMCVLPLYHINGLTVTLMGPLVSGGSVVFPQKFSASKFWPLIDEYECTWFSVVPTQISYLLHAEPRTSDIAPGHKRLRFGRSASAPLSPEVQQSFEDRFGVAIIETMGLTETAAPILSNPLPPGVRKIGSPGIGFGCKVIIANNELEEVARNTEGEILVRGDNVMKGYFKNPDATSDAITKSGWLRTGDLGKQDDDGYVFVTGRLKELIIKGGENIAPREIDEALYRHPAVIEAAAFACPCHNYGQRVEAAVSIDIGSELDEKALLDFCRAHLGQFKMPDRIYFLEELPKGPSGKIQRRRLVELFVEA